jgi:hypothetical protein
VYRNSVRGRNWIDASKSLGLLSFFYYFLLKFPGQSSSPSTQNRVVRRVTVVSRPCCPPPEVAGQYRQPSTTIDQHRQGPCHWTGEAQSACPLLLSTCRLLVIIYFPLYISDFRLIYFFTSTFFDLGVRRSRFRFPVVSLEFFIDIILPAAL